MKKAITVFSVFYASAFNVIAQSATDVTKQLASAIGLDIKGYKLYSEPTNNFGLGTACLKKFDLAGGNVACDMVSCYGLEAFPENSTEWRSVNGMAYIGAGPGIAIDKQVAKSYGIALIVPKILQILSINASYLNKSTLDATINIDTILKRSLNYDHFMQHVLGSSQSGRLYNGYQNRDLVIAVADFVLVGYHVELKPTDSLGIKVGLKVDSLLKLGSVITLDKDSLGVTFSKSANGTIIMSSSKPVILGVSVVKQKNIATQESGHTFDEENGWEFVNPSNYSDPSVILIPNKKKQAVK